MRSFLIISFFLVIIPTAYGQSQIKDEDTQKILTWIVKTEHISSVYFKIDSRALNNPFRDDGDVLPCYVSVGDAFVPISQRKRLKDLLTVDEIATFRLSLKDFKEIKWKKTPYKMDVKFFRQSSFHQTSDSTLAVFSYLSMPIFLNKEKTRAFIGKSWIADSVIGGGELLLCELDNNEWHVIARVGLWAN